MASAKRITMVVAASFATATVACGATSAPPRWLKQVAATTISHDWPPVGKTHVSYRVAPDWAIAIYRGRFRCEASCSFPASAAPPEYKFIILDYARPSRDFIVAISCNDFSACKAKLRSIGVRV